MDSRDNEPCRALLAAVIASGLHDDDHEFVLSPIFQAYCSLVGLEPDTVLETRIRYCLNELDPISMDAKRFDADNWPTLWGRLPR